MPMNVFQGNVLATLGLGWMRGLPHIFQEALEQVHEPSRHAKTHNQLEAVQQAHAEHPEQVTHLPGMAHNFQQLLHICHRGTGACMRTVCVGGLGQRRGRMAGPWCL